MFDTFILTAAILKVGYALVAAGGLIFLSAWLDQRAKRAFSQSLETIARSPLALAVYYGLRFVALGILVGLLGGCADAHARTLFPTRYDREIASAVRTYWPEYPWASAWKAQLYQESRLNPEAVSQAGAAGLAQIMPGTWEDLRRQLRLGPEASPHDDIAIQAGAFYMAKLRHAWTTPRPADRRQELAQASYNAGTGNVIAAQRACGGARDWREIAPCLSTITGAHHAAETIGYVAAIAKWRTMMEAGL